jgi:hypothetical protein
MTARIFNALVGVWVFVSAFVWPHAQAQKVNTAICGVLAVALAVATMYSEAARYVNVALGVWLFLSTFLLPGLGREPLWSNAIMGIAIFASALIESGPDDIRRERELYGRTS